MFRIFLFALTVTLTLSVQFSLAYAGFERWTSQVENNPFTGGTDVTVLYNLSARSQVSLSCDSAENGVNLVAIPGWEMTSSIDGFEPSMKIAVDGNIILSGLIAQIGAFGENLAGAYITLTKEDAVKLTEAFVTAQKQIAIEDGMSTKPFLMSARGSTASALKLKQCYEAQKGISQAPATDDQLGKQARIAEIQAEIKKLRNELLELVKGE